MESQLIAVSTLDGSHWSHPRGAIEAMYAACGTRPLRSTLGWTSRFLQTLWLSSSLISNQHNQEKAKSLHIKRKVKTTAFSDIFTSATEIIEKIMDEDINNEPIPILPTPMNLTKAATCHRKCHCLKDAVNLDLILLKVFFWRISCANTSQLVTLAISSLLQIQ